MSETKLLPCPFCGGEVKYFRPSHHIEHFVNHHTIYCEHCDFRMEGVSALQLMNRWNTRKPMERIVEQLEADERHTFDGCINKRFAIEIVKQAAAEYNNGWIPCSEKLPEDGVAVLVQDFEEFYEIGICETKNGVKGFACGEWWSSANNYIAWQPLPAPYQPKEKV